MMEKINPMTVKVKAIKTNLTGGFPEVLVFTNRVAYNAPKKIERLIKGIAYIDHVFPALHGIIRRIRSVNPVAKNPPPTALIKARINTCKFGSLSDHDKPIASL